MADGTSFQIDIDADASTAEQAAAKVDLLAKRLAEAGQASSSASDAVKAAEQAYAQTEATADRAAKALERINVSLETQKGKMTAAMAAGDDAAYARAAAAAARLTERQTEATAAAEKAKAALSEEAASLDKLRSAASQAATTEATLKDAHDQATKAADGLKKAEDAAGGSGKVNEMAEAFAKLGGPLGQAGQKALGAADGLKKLLGSMGTTAGAIVAVAVVVAALAASFVAGTVAILKWSIGLSDANRSARLLSDGIAGSVAGGRELDAAIQSLEKRVPQTGDELQSMAADLAKTGLKGKALTDALEDAATKAAELKFGPDFAKEAISLTKLSARLHTNISGLFGGLNLEGFLSGLSKIVDLFDQTSVTGKAIKVVFESIFQPLTDGLASLAPMIVRTFIQLEIWAMKGLIAIKPYGSTIMMVVKGFAVLGAVVVGAIAVVLANIALLVLALGLVAGGVVWLVSKAWDLGNALVEGAGSALTWLSQKFDEITAFLSGFSLFEIGSGLIQGLVDGIIGGGSALLSAIGGVVKGAISSAKNLLGIKSPSKVFAEIGENTAAGMAGGVEGGSADVQSSLEAMVSPPTAAEAAPAAKASASSGGNTFEISINAPGGDAPSIAAAVREVLLQILEGDAVQAGAGVPA